MTAVPSMSPLSPDFARPTVRRHLRLLRRIALVVFVVLVTVFGLSLVWAYGWQGRQLTLIVDAGALNYVTVPHATPRGWLRRRTEARIQWEFSRAALGLGGPLGREWPPPAPGTSPRWKSPLPPGVLYWRGCIPLWIPLVCSGFLTFLLLAFERLPLPWQCRQCGYNLTGNISGCCPECGAGISSVSTAQPR